jgi:hypothetical protein
MTPSNKMPAAIEDRQMEGFFMSALVRLGSTTGSE